ncbi:EcsC family protein [Xanthomonas campestris]|uniref:EcsC family protein n=1 Tax=Xanthomonas campestris TaxID=339 RepID=UPI001E2CCEE3|nr:EcsC family protein [Xanthomonas campestris]MCC8688758.1 EcsC family protein [Xanthomonas campestris]
MSASILLLASALAITLFAKSELIISTSQKDCPVAKELTESKIMQALDFAYDKAMTGLPGLDSAIEMADSYLKETGSLEEKANSLVRWQNTKAATSGFLTGLGGLLVMPVTIPANLASVYFIQIRMIAAIAHMAGYNVRDDKVKAMVYACLTGNAAKEVLKDVGIQFGKKLAQASINRITGATIISINKAVGFRLLTKAGTTGVVNLGKMVPILGGVIGGAVDLAMTNIVGNTAVKVFISEEPEALAAPEA